MKKIFLYCLPVEDDASKHLLGVLNRPVSTLCTYALAEDGTGLIAELVDHQIHIPHLLGISSRRNHSLYSSHFPEGYALVDLTSLSPEELSSRPDFTSAINSHLDLESNDSDLHTLGESNG